MSNPAVPLVPVCRLQGFDRFGQPTVEVIIGRTQVLMTYRVHLAGHPDEFQTAFTLYEAHMLAASILIERFMGH